jgi:hypothetical protein
MRNLSKKGLSMSQAQSISNLCNQRAREIETELASFNVCQKTIKIGTDEYVQQEALPMPKDILGILEAKGQLHATQAFLMEAIKAKEAHIRSLQFASCDHSHIAEPERPDYREAVVENLVDEAWGWAQLTDAEYSEYLHTEAMAAHLGQFIHKNGKLTEMRKELSDLPSIEWFEVEAGKKTPIKISKHHSSAELMDAHEAIAAKHREYEQKVNYYKAKVKNLVSDENARIQKDNADAVAKHAAIVQVEREAYMTALKAYREEVLQFEMEFNSRRETAIKEAAALRINVDPRFQPVINMFITKSED